MGELAGDESIVRKRATHCILPGKRSRDGLGALDTDVAPVQVEGGQRGADQTVKKRAEEGKWGS